MGWQRAEPLWAGIFLIKRYHRSYRTVKESRPPICGAPMNKPDLPYVFYHNPRCSKSRQALALLHEHGIEPVVIDYLKSPPSAAELGRILDKLGIEPRALLRSKEKEYQDAGLDDPKLSRRELIAAMVKHPILIERPILVTPDQAAVGRPPEQVLKII
jgi:arsenate reductase